MWRWKVDQLPVRPFPQVQATRMGGNRGAAPTEGAAQEPPGPPENQGGPSSGFGL